MPTAADTLSNDNCMKQYQAIIDDFSKDANDIIHIKLPAKVMQLQKLLKEASEFNLDSDAVVAAIEVATVSSANESNNVGSPTRKKRKQNSLVKNENYVDDMTPRTMSVLKCNQAVVAPLSLLKEHMLDMIELIGTVKISIQLAIPRIEDGNNFGVSIQEETVSELSRAEDGVFSILESMAGYFVARAKVGSKMLKYPQVQDYLMAVKELDSKMYTNLKLFCSDLRNNAALLHDLIIKNLEKIRSPRSSNHQSSMY